MAMANTPSLNASRRFFLCLNFDRLLLLRHLVSPIRAGRLPRRAGADIPDETDGGRAALPASRPPSFTPDAIACDQAVSASFLWCLRAPNACLSAPAPALRSGWCARA